VLILSDLVRNAWCNISDMKELLPEKSCILICFSLSQCCKNGNICDEYINAVSRGLRRMLVVIECSGENIECNTYGKRWCRYNRYGVDTNDCFGRANFYCDSVLSGTNLFSHYCSSSCDRCGGMAQRCLEYWDQLWQ
jgi:hypothetical protein